MHYENLGTHSFKKNTTNKHGTWDIPFPKFSNFLSPISAKIICFQDGSISFLVFVEAFW